jgi:PTS system mannose-specific IIA component
MIGVVLCTHRSLAQALRDTAEMILGELPQVEVIAVEPGDAMDALLTRLRQAIDAVNVGDGVLVLCDMFGGTPSNLALSFLSDEVEVVTGVNLPMLLKLSQSREGAPSAAADPTAAGGAAPAPSRLAQVAASVRDHARENILVAGELLRKRKA